MSGSRGTLGATVGPDGTTSFCVWAPQAERLTLLLPESGSRLGMSRDADGYFTAVAAAPPGTLYAYMFEDGRVRPDPASRAQPTNTHVHGPSMVTAPLPPAAGFLNPPLVRHVIYELHVGAFTPEGTFDAAITRLDDLRSLGVTAVELMPVAQFPGTRNWGYDGVGLFAAQWSYGGVDGLRRLAVACHERGLALVLDVVYNHLGPEGNYLGEFGPYFSDRHTTGWGDALNFDGRGSDHVREFFIQNALYWVIDCGLDGLRLDAVHAIHDRTARPFLAELAERVHSAAEREGRRALLIAESSDNDPRLVRPGALGGLGLDGCWNDDFHHSVRAALTGERLGYYASYGAVDQIAKCVRDRYVYAGEHAPGYQRRHGAPARDVPHGRFVVCTQNHDQVGNRPLGDRLDELAGADGARVAAGLVLLSPFTPMLWMGEEYGETAPFLYFVSHTDTTLVEAVRRGRRQEFADFHGGEEVPDPQDAGTFERSKLRWTLRGSGAHGSRLAYYAELLRLRRELDIPGLSAGADAFTCGGSTVVLTYRGVLVAANLGASRAELDVPAADARAGDWRIVLDSSDGRWGGPGDPDRAVPAARLVLPARTLVVMLAEDHT
jgi:maltooligosyltrehalose trehalohydrolase